MGCYSYGIITTLVHPWPFRCTLDSKSFLDRFFSLDRVIHPCFIKRKKTKYKDQTLMTRRHQGWPSLRALTTGSKFNDYIAEPISDLEVSHSGVASRLKSPPLLFAEKEHMHHLPGLVCHRPVKAVW